MSELVAVDERDGVAVVRFDRPPVNAIDLGVVRAVRDAFGRVAALPANRPVVLTGTGRCFSAGLDVKVVPAYGADEQREMLRTINRVVHAVYGMPRPVVAALNGHALAAGLVVALACDYRVATSGACKLGLPEVTAGIPYPAAPLRVVHAELSPQAARVLVLTGRAFTAEQGLAAGVVDEIVAPERVLPRAIEVARELATAPVYGRIKQQYRAETIAALGRIVEENDDPMLRQWV